LTAPLAPIIIITLCPSSKQTYISYGVRRAQALDDAAAVDPLSVGGPGALQVCVWGNALGENL
jgi:hypothetical protein